MKSFCFLSLFLFYFSGMIYGQNKIDSLRNSSEFIIFDSTSYEIVELDSTTGLYKTIGYIAKMLIFDSIPRLYKVNRIDTCYSFDFELILISVEDLSGNFIFTIITYSFENPFFCKDPIQIGSIYYLTLYEIKNDSIRFYIPIKSIIEINNIECMFFSRPVINRLVTTPDIRGICYEKQ